MEKSYCIFASDTPGDGALLVFATDRNKARQRAVKYGPWDWEYVDTKARRTPYYDKFRAAASINGIVEYNEQLPKDAEPFYSEEI